MLRFLTLTSLLAMLLLAPVLAAPLAPGDPVPNFTLTDQTGRKVQLEDFRGRTVILTFFYRTCPEASMCPRLMARLRKAWEAARPRTGDRLRVLAITLDPKNDTSQVLARYADAQRVSAPEWRFLTGPGATIRSVASLFGVTSMPGRDGKIDHNMGTAILSSDLRLVRVFAGSDWDPAEVGDAAARAAGR